MIGSVRARWTVAAVLLAAIAFMLAPAGSARSDSYPDRSIRLIVPYAPGGGTDIIARIFAAQLSSELKQTVFVENHDGAGGIVGAGVVAKAKNDGYTLLFTPQGPITIAPNFQRPLSYDPKKDLLPVAMVAEQPILFVVNKSNPASDFQQFIAAAKKNPGTLNFGSPGVGTEMDLTVDLLQQQTGIKMVHLPYKGGGPAISALLRGDIAMMPVVPSSILPYVKNGNVKVIATTAAKRLDSLPDVPTTKELGIADVDIRPWWGIFAPKDTLQDVVKRIETAAKAVGDNPQYREKMKNVSTDIVFVGGEQFSAMLAKQTARWGQIIGEFHIVLE